MAEELEKPYRFWIWSLASMIFPFCIILFPENINLSSRPELSTPLTSLRRLAEGYWLKQASMSPYSDMEHSFFIFCGYIGFSLLSTVMHNLWIWRGTGNANFYYGNAMGYACFQFMFVEESVRAMLNHDQALKKATAEITKN